MTEAELVNNIGDVIRQVRQGSEIVIEQHSPRSTLRRVCGTFLLIHGTGDDNVHIQATERLVNRLIEIGTPVDMMFYPNRSYFLFEGSGTLYHQHLTIAAWQTCAMERLMPVGYRER